jgi:hypothetical protein
LLPSLALRHIQTCATCNTSPCGSTQIAPLN